MPSRLLLAFVLLPFSTGCLAGEEKFFPDESARLAALHVNGYGVRAQDGSPGARIEVSGLSAQKEEIAFKGRVSFVLEKQDASRPEHTYAVVREWSVDVEADDFASPTVPVHVQQLGVDEVEPGFTYRIQASAEVGGRAFRAEPALFFVGA